MTANERIHHIYTLAETHRLGLLFTTDPKKCGYAPDQRFIATVLPVDEVGYAVALHEFGHALGPGGLRTVATDHLKLADPKFFHLLSGVDEFVAITERLIRDERGAWAWARTHALEWTPAMQATSAYGVRSYTDGLDEVKEAFSLWTKRRR